MWHLLIGIPLVFICFICVGIYCAFCAIKIAHNRSKKIKKMKEAISHSPSFQHEIDKDPILKSWFIDNPAVGVDLVHLSIDNIVIYREGKIKTYKICKNENELEEERNKLIVK